MKAWGLVSCLRWRWWCQRWWWLWRLTLHNSTESHLWIFVILWLPNLIATRHNAFLCQASLIISREQMHELSSNAHGLESNDSTQSNEPRSRIHRVFYISYLKADHGSTPGYPIRKWYESPGLNKADGLFIRGIEFSTTIPRQILHNRRIWSIWDGFELKRKHELQMYCQKRGKKEKLGVCPRKKSPE